MTASTRPRPALPAIRRVGEAAALFADSGIICITAFISPYRVDRDRARASAPGRFHEIHIKADVETCEQRDPKGLYKRARSGEISQFTGISARSEEHTSELQSLMRISYAVFCLKKKKKNK